MVLLAFYFKGLWWLIRMKRNKSFFQEINFLSCMCKFAKDTTFFFEYVFRFWNFFDQIRSNKYRSNTCIIVFIPDKFYHLQKHLKRSINHRTKMKDFFLKKTNSSIFTFIDRDSKAFKRFLLHTTILSFSANEVIPTSKHKFYFVAEGTVDVENCIRRRNNIFLGCLLKGSSFSHDDNLSYKASVSRAVIYEIPFSEVYKILDRHRFEGINIPGLTIPNILCKSKKMLKFHGKWVWKN